MTPNERKELAASLFRQGYNCSQSMVLAFSDELDLPEDRLCCLASSFGGGMGRLREVCGSMTGTFMILGLLYGYQDPGADQEKAELYFKVQELALAFEKEHGSILCRDLLGLTDKHDSSVPSARTDAYYSERPCEKLIGDAARRLQEYLDAHPHTLNNI